MKNLVGQTLLDRYRVDAFIGQGGMALVYKAWDKRRSYYVAIKVVQEELLRDSHFGERFREEAKLLQELRHPHIVRYYDFEEAGDLAFLVIEYVEGESLRSKLAALEKPLSLGQALSILEPVCIALHFAHEEGVIHCDVKPANTLIKTGGHVLLSDFGIARWTQAVTQGQFGGGAPAYMAPEQCTGGSLDRRTDVYALGLTAYEMLTLDRPFRGDTTATPGSTVERIRWEHIHREPPRPASRNPAITVEAEQAILRALAKQSAGRQPDVLTFLRELSNQGRVQVETIAPWPERQVSPASPVERWPEPVPPAPPTERRPEPTETGSQPSLWQRWGFKPPAGSHYASGGQLQVIRGESPGLVYPLGVEDVHIGRARDNQLRLYHRSVSRYHARICYANGCFYLQDQGSMHGTYVNGQQVEAVALNDGDQIQIGETEFLFRLQY